MRQIVTASMATEPYLSSSCTVYGCDSIIAVMVEIGGGPGESISTMRFRLCKRHARRLYEELAAVTSRRKDRRRTQN